MKKTVSILFLLFLFYSGSVYCQTNKPWGSDKAQWQEVSFVAKCDGTEQLYTKLLPENFNPNQSYDLVMVFHGMGGDRWQLFNLQDVEQQCRAMMDVIIENQLIVVSPDYRIDQWMGPDGEADTLQILVDIKRQYRINKVFLAGGSMGGSSVLTLTVRYPYLFDGVMSMNGTANHLEFENYQDCVQKGFGGTKAQIPLEYKNRSAEYWPERIIMPIGLSVGGQDGAVPPQSVTRLANVLKKMNRKVLFIYREEMGHGTLYDDARAIFEFAIGVDAKKEKEPKK